MSLLKLFISLIAVIAFLSNHLSPRKSDQAQAVSSSESKVEAETLESPPEPNRPPLEWAFLALQFGIGAPRGFANSSSKLNQFQRFSSWNECRTSGLAPPSHA